MFSIFHLILFYHWIIFLYFCFLLFCFPHFDVCPQTTLLIIHYSLLCSHVTSQKFAFLFPTFLFIYSLYTFCYSLLHTSRKTSHWLIHIFICFLIFPLLMYIFSNIFWKGYVYGEHMYTHGWFMSMYGKNHYNIVISLQLK